MFWIRPAREQRLWYQLVDEAWTWVDAGAAFLHEPVAPVSRWSPAQHLYHVAVAHRPVLRWLQRQVGAAPGDASDADPAGRPNVAGYLVLALGRLPRGRSRSPDAFRPPEGVAPDDLAHRVEANRTMLANLADATEVLRRSPARLAHPALGPLNARQWLRFGRIHTAHHHRIIRDMADVGA